VFGGSGKYAERGRETYENMLLWTWRDARKYCLDGTVIPTGMSMCQSGDAERGKHADG
jgi:hypothetical protein